MPSNRTWEDPTAAGGRAVGPRARLAALVRLLRKHLGITILIGLGVLLRALFMVGYPPAFWFMGDSGNYIIMTYAPLEPHLQRPLGFVVMLRALRPTGTLVAVAAFQHLLSLLVALGVYLLLQRRGVPRWLSCLAAAPVLFDSLMLTMGHYLLPDMLFTALFAAAVGTLLWSPRPGAPASVSAGLLIAAAWFTKPTALPVALLLGLYLLIRRAGWRCFVGYAVAFLVPYVGVLAWVGDRPSVYGSQSGTALYGRTAIIADCARLKLTPEQRIACPDQPLGQRWDRADAFYWRRPDRMSDAWMAAPEGRKALTGFSLEVIRQQPLDYLAIVAKESAAHFVPGLYLGPMNECLRERLVPPTSFRARAHVRDLCPPAQAGPDFHAAPIVPNRAAVATPLTRTLHTYGEYARQIPIVLSLAVLITFAALVARRRVPRRIRLDALLLVLAGPGLAIFTVAIGMYEPRYALPALPLAAVAAALGWHGLAHRTGTRGGRNTG
ncbi:hypothetical protein [Micromonospora sp. NPDC049679]|uniref:hypothetical protein n=1 Tax=Micromonospora sp. NPDC049679 TaxID=3155920 RepID=UPI0033E0F1AD